MARCGNYELDRAIGWGRRSTYFAARVNGANGPALHVIRRARTVERSMGHSFMRAAAEQQAAVEAGCRRLAPIFAFDWDESGFAFYATNRYETSLADFLEAGCKVDSPLLREIVTGVLGALAELQEKSRRAHGNLTAGNILLDAQGIIHLTDLAPSSKDATTADDLFALGTLIYQLVRRTARIGTLNPPLEYSPEWTESLGDDDEGWREFTNRLLKKSPDAGAGAIKLALGDLKSLARLAEKAVVAPMVPTGVGPQPQVRRAPPKKKSPLPKVIAIILLLAGAGGGYVWYQNKEADKKKQAELALQKKLLEERDASLPEAIKILRVQLKQPLPDKIAGDKTLSSLLGRIAKALDGTGNKSDVKSLLGNWELPGKLTTQAATWRNEPREWTHLAGLLDAAAQIDAEGDASIIEQLERAIDARNAADELDRLWTEITLILGDLKAANNSRLPDFTPWAVDEIVSVKTLAEGPTRAQEALEKLRGVLTFQREKGPRVLWDRFEKEAAAVVKTPASGLRQGWPDRWKQEAERLIGPSDEKRAEWKKILDEKKLRIANLPPKDRSKWEKILEPQLDATANALESEVAAIDARLSPGPAGVFKGLRTPEEEDYDKYEPFLKKWSETAANAKDMTEAAAALQAFDRGTKSLNVTARYQTAKFVQLMTDGLKTPDKVSLEFSKPNDWILVRGEATYAIYKYKQAVDMPFLPLAKTGYAMAAVETPLSLAKLSGSVLGKPGNGPQTRTETMDATVDWTWTDLRTFIQAFGPGIGISTYFGPGVVAGDTGRDSVPVTWLSFKEASKMAENLGGQLPTVEQWRIANPQAGAVRRLRSTAWSTQFQLVEKWKTLTPGHAGRLPDAGSFSKARTLTPGGAHTKDFDPTPGAPPDPALWLKSVFRDGRTAWNPADRADKFLNLIGNAAEWVNAGDAPETPRPAVMGASVVSPGSLKPDAVLSPPDAGYFDVTFRLVVKQLPGGEGAGLIAFKKAVAETVADFAALPPPKKQ